MTENACGWLCVTCTFTNVMVYFFLGIAGRQFYKCPKRVDSCDFFLWADETSNSSSARLNTSLSQPGNSRYSSNSQTFTSRQRGNAASNTTYSSFNYNSTQGHFNSALGSTSNPSEDGAGSVVMCNCGTEAVRRTVQKEGPSKGRQFYTCHKPRDTQCGFFEWADSVPTSNVYGTRNTWSTSASNRRVPDEGQRNPINESVRKRKPPTCSVCKQQGHTKRSCPRAKEFV